MKKIIITIIILLLIILVGCSKKETTRPTFDYETGIVSFDNQINVSVQIVDTFAKRMTGLMYRENLDEFSGMLFIFDDEQIRDFWMKNTLIPLDIIFINSSYTIVKIQHAIPCKEDPCMTYSSQMPAMYVVEVNKDFSQKNKIKEGMKVEFIY